MSRTAADLLARHAGHHLQVVDAERTRCLTCSHTLLVRAGLTTMTEQDRPAHVEATANAARPCPLHVGELAHACRCCRSERIAQPDNVPLRLDHQPTADVATWANACRAAVAAAKARRG